MEYDELGWLRSTIESLRNQTLKTTWIVKEIDKITSMIYFIIVIITFIGALAYSLLLLPEFDDNLLTIFQADNQTRNSAFQHIDRAILAAENNDREGLRVNIEEARKAVKEIQDEYVRSIWVTVVIVILSSGALGAILYILRKRRGALKANAITVFNFLMVQEAYDTARRTIKIHSHTSDNGETFEKSLHAAEQYITNGDWTIANIRVRSLVSDYERLFAKRVGNMVHIPKKEAPP